MEWAREVCALGAGEILLTSIDQEGTRKGFDLDLVRAVSQAVTIPVIASGGMGTPEHIAQAVEAGADAVAIADVLHYQRLSIPEIREAVRKLGIAVRTPPPNSLSGSIR